MEKALVGITWEFVFQIVNTFIIFLLLRKLLFKPVLNIIESRENDIKSDLAEGEKAKNEGLALKKEYESKINFAKDEGQEIIKQATIRAEQKSDDIVNTAKKDALDIKEKANKDKVINEIKNDISNIALLAASKVIEKDLDKSKHEELIENFIKEVGEAK
ncbi:F0F1 ATP synthase subunit B [Clostridioides difficile]